MALFANLVSEVAKSVLQALTAVCAEAVGLWVQILTVRTLVHLVSRTVGPVHLQPTVQSVMIILSLMEQVLLEIVKNATLVISGSMIKLVMPAHLNVQLANMQATIAYPVQPV